MKSIEEPAPPVTAARIAVWDLPTRLFHWALAALIGLSWWSAEEGEIELHFYSGYAILALLLFRLLWGLFGSSTARFGNFVKGPAAVLAYVRDMRGWRAIGHQPLGALASLGLLALTLLQVATGLVNSDDDGLYGGPLAHLVSIGTVDAAHELHKSLFNLLLAMIAVHVAAILLYRLVLGKRLLGPMIHGRALAEPGTEPMRPARRWAALLCLAAALAVTRWVVAGAPPLGG